MNKLVLIAAGGTGGHVFPAESLAHELKARGWTVHLATDSRAERFAGKFPADGIHIIQSATFGSKNPIVIVKTAWSLFSGVRAARRLIRALKPSIVIGFGGYPTLPPLYAGTMLGIPTLIHEQNAVMGRANAALAKRVTAIAGGFLPESGAAYPAKTILTGNPVRPEVLAASSVPYSLAESGDFNLLVFGGSQGAQYFSKAIPEAIEIVSETMRKQYGNHTETMRNRLLITQQARAEDEAQLRADYERMGVRAKVSPFFDNMAQRIAKAHFVISRAGASTVSELGVIGRPSLLVPYPFALDHDQAANAAALQAAGGAMVVKQAELTPQKIADIILSIMNDPQKAAATAAAAKSSSMPHATQLLSDLAEAIANGKTVGDFKRRAIN